MSNYFLYADEAGCFTFNRKQNISKYFIIATIVTQDWMSPTLALQQLRHDLVAEGLPVGDYFHASSDTQAVRNRVFEEIMKHEFTIQATICEKSKAQPQVTVSKSRFYQYPWLYHCKRGIVPILENPTSLHITAASIGNRKEKKTFFNSLKDVQRQSFQGGEPCVVDFRPCSSDPCLQLADYCAWAIQRKWEQNDIRSYEIVQGRITREYDLWARGTKHYY